MSKKRNFVWYWGKVICKETPGGWENFLVQSNFEHDDRKQCDYDVDQNEFFFYLWKSSVLRNQQKKKLRVQEILAEEE